MEILTDAFYEELANQLDDSSGSLKDEEIEEIIEDLISKIIPDLAKSVNKTLLSDRQRMLEERREIFNGFCERNYQRWKPAFDLFETFIVICTEAGENFNNSYRSTAAKENDVVFDIVVRLHARACHIAQEIMCLMKSGFPDGAHARWRALHEVTVTAMFIKEHGLDCAERYYRHEVIESYKGMLQHREVEHRLQEKGSADKGFEECEKRYQETISQYGKSFGKPYGWASNILTSKQVTFADIEKNVSLDHMRPYYRWASHNVHAGVKGITNQLGLCEAKEDILLAGPSNSGMTDPAHCSAISLLQITTALLAIKSNIDRLVVLNIIFEMEKEIGETFSQCDNRDALQE